MSLNQIKPNPIDLKYMYQEDLALNNQQWLICHKIKPYQSSLQNQITYMTCAYLNNKNLDDIYGVWARNSLELP